MMDDFAQRGVEIIAISMNTEDVAKTTAEEWRLDRLSLGYGLDLEDARRWGLFASASIKDKEPAHFVEPGIFLVQPDGMLYASMLQSMPFTRPPAKELLSSIEWILEHDYPARGEMQLS